MTCPDCKARARLRRILGAGGAPLVAWYCPACRAWAARPVRWLAHAYVRSILERHGLAPDLDQIPLLEDYRAECEVCGEAGAEWHHFFPTAIRREVFGEGEQNAAWEHFGAYLCPYHHRLWHYAVTWYLPGFAAADAALSIAARYGYQLSEPE